MLSDCRIVSLPKLSDYRGSLTFIEGSNHIPFEIRRIYYLYDVPDGKTRGGHAHKELEQFIIAISGSFEVILDDGFERRSFCLNCAHYGLYVPPMTWRDLHNFSSGAVCLVLASLPYDEADYYRNYDEFLKAVRG